MDGALHGSDCPCLLVLTVTHWLPTATISALRDPSITKDILTHGRKWLPQTSLSTRPLLRCCCLGLDWRGWESDSHPHCSGLFPRISSWEFPLSPKSKWRVSLATCAQSPSSPMFCTPENGAVVFPQPLAHNNYIFDKQTKFPVSCMSNKGVRLDNLWAVTRLK